ncbi:MAG: efflux RND transporter permease subunit [Hyphomicrobiales bacterium]
MIEAFGQFAVRKPLIAICLVLFVSACALFGATQLQVNDGMQTAFAGDTPAYQNFLDHQQRFTTSESDIVILFSGPEALQPSDLSAIRDFVFDASLATHVDSVFSLFSLRTPPDENNRTAALFPNDLQAIDDLPTLLAGAREHALGGARLLSENFRYTMVIVSLLQEHSELEPARETLAELDGYLDVLRGSSRLSAESTGLIPIRQSVIDGQIQDLLILNLIGIVLGSLLCLVALRSLPLALLTGLPAANALFWVLGAMGLLGLEINLLTNVVPVLILVLALADSLHLTLDLQRHLRSGKTAKQAVSLAMRRVAPACALTSFTTAIAFAALCISDSQLVRSLGWAGGMGTLVSLCSVLLIHPLAFLIAMRVPHLEKALRASRPSEGAIFSGSTLYGFAFRFPRLVAMGSLALLALAVGTFAFAKTEYSFLENLSKSDPAMIALGEVGDHLTATATIDIPITLPVGGLSNPHSLSVIKTAAQIAQTTLPDASVTSFDDLVRWIGDRDEISGFFRAGSLFDDLSASQQQRLISKDRSTALVRVFLPDRGARETQSTLASLQNAFAADPETRDAVQAPTGLLAMSSEISLTMIRHLNVSFSIAVLAAGLFVALWYRSLGYGVLALVPNVLPIACVGAWLTISGNGLQFSSAIALTIAFGIAVDDTIHVLNRMRLTAPTDSPFDLDAIRKAYAEISPALVTTTLVLGFGMLGTQFANIPTIKYFGALTIVVFALALLSVLVALPGLMVIASKMLKRAAGYSREK